MFAKRTAWPSSPNPLALEVERLKNEGTPALDLTVSNPTRCGFSYLNAEILNAFLSPSNLIYSPHAKGDLACREAVADYYASRGVEISPDHIMLTASTSEAYSYIFRLLANPNDAILCPSPSYPLIDYLADLHDVHVWRYRLSAPDWKIAELPGKDKDLAVKAILTVHPNNPTGHYTGEQDRRNLNEWATRCRAALIADEVFWDYALNGKPPAPSFAGNGDVLTFTLSGLSKIMGLPQMKLSWIAASGPKALVEEALSKLEIISDTFLSVGAPVQHAAKDWFRTYDGFQKEIKQRLQQNLETLRKGLGPTVLSHLEPEGGWYALVKLSHCEDDETACLELLRRQHVLIHPGYLFDFPDGAYGVISLLPKPEVFLEGIEKLAAHFSSKAV